MGHALPWNPLCLSFLKGMSELGAQFSTDSRLLRHFLSLVAVCLCEAASFFTSLRALLTELKWTPC